MAFVYRALVAAGDKVCPTSFLPFWNHPAGPKTVFFWAPTFKWVSKLLLNKFLQINSEYDFVLHKLIGLGYCWFG